MLQFILELMSTFVVVDLALIRHDVARVVARARVCQWALEASMLSRLADASACTPSQGSGAGGPALQGKKARRHRTGGNFGNAAVLGGIIGTGGTCDGGGGGGGGGWSWGGGGGGGGSSCGGGGC